MEVYIDNKNLEDYDIQVLDYRGALGFASERANERVWQDKSGVDKNLVNVRYEPKEFLLSCLVKADNELEAYSKVNDLVTDLFNRGVVVLSLRDTASGLRESFPVERSTSIISNISIRQQNSLYVFKLGLRDINPNAVKYKTTIVSGEASIIYDKGQTAVIYWGDGSRSEVSNSGVYEKDDYASDGLVDIIIDIDSDAPTITPLVADFEASPQQGSKDLEVQFTDLTTGEPITWSWNFGDEETSSEQNPEHTYTENGVYTVTLQVFNEAQGTAVYTIDNYITVTSAEIYLNDSTLDFMLINDAGDKILTN